MKLQASQMHKVTRIRAENTPVTLCSVPCFMLYILVKKKCVTHIYFSAQTDNNRICISICTKFKTYRVLFYKVTGGVSNLLGEIYRVSMIGHRIVEDFDIEEKLYDLFCDMLRTKEYVEFYLGRNGDFDIMAASVIKWLQKNFRDDNSVMILVLPYPVKDYEDYEKYYDEIVIPKELYGVHPKAAITERNRWMVTNTDVLVAYIRNESDGTAACVRMAEQLGQAIIKI